VFYQIAADIEIESVHHRLQEIKDAWMYQVDEQHPTKAAMVSAGIDYMKTGYCLLSLCLPSTCYYTGRTPALSSVNTENSDCH
jgi:hypothetical protein